MSALTLPPLQQAALRTSAQRSAQQIDLSLELTSIERLLVRLFFPYSGKASFCLFVGSL